MEKLGKALLFFSVFFLTHSASAEFKVKASLSSSNVEIGDVVGYIIELSSDKDLRSPGANFSPPNLKGLEFQNVSQSSSTSVSYTNGSVAKEYVSVYTLNYLATEEGSVLFPAVDLDISEKIKTKPLSLKIYKTLPQNLRQQQMPQANSFGSSNSLIDQIFGRSQRPSSQDSNEPIEFFTDVEIDKTEIYKGEQLVATWYIYVTPGTSLGTFDTLRFPTLKGFWKEDVNFASRFYWKNVTKDGKRYMRALLSSYALTPYNSGTYIIDPFELRTVATRGFFNASRKILKAESTPIAINVKPLPEPIPETFSGGVGRFKIDSVKTNSNRNVLLREPFEVSFRVVGDESTTKFLKTPKMDLSEDFKLYKVKEDHKFVTSKVSSYKTFNYSLIPKKEGVYRFPDLKMSFLNAETGEYYDEYVKLPTYKVLPNKNAPQIFDEAFEEEGVLTAESEKNQLESMAYQENTNGRGFFELLYFSLPLIWTLFILLIAGLGSFILFRKLSYVLPVKESLAFELEKRALLVSTLLKENKRNQSLSELINILSLLVGAVNGKRFGAEKEIEQAVRSLPASLKSSGLKLKDLNDELQEMRFGSSLESYTNKDKLETCLKDFKKLFLEFREYLR
jgi:hypothetical protein